MTEISRDRAVVTIGANKVSFVPQAVGEIRQPIRGITGNAPRLCPDPAEATRSSTLVIAGHSMAERMSVQPAITEDGLAACQGNRKRYR